VLASAVLEGLAGRWAADRATDEQIASVRELFSDAITNPTHLDAEQYSAINLQFQQ